MKRVKITLQIRSRINRILVMIPVSIDIEVSPIFDHLYCIALYVVKKKKGKEKYIIHVIRVISNSI